MRTRVILYVADVEVSTTFYRQAFSKEPAEVFAGFAVFSLTDDVIIALQERDSIEPPAEGAPGSVELSMSYATRSEVDEIHQAWSRLGIHIILPPTELEFGYTFVAADPDGHRLRVCATDTSNL